MKFDEFITRVQERANISRLEAEKATRATLSTLAERISGGERRDLTSQLPTGLAVYMYEPFVMAGELPFGPAGRHFSLEQFFLRVSMREEVPVAAAIEHARAVMGVLSEAVTRGEIEDVLAQLPNEFYPLFGVPEEYTPRQKQI